MIFKFCATCTQNIVMVLYKAKAVKTTAETSLTTDQNYTDKASINDWTRLCIRDSNRRLDICRQPEPLLSTLILKAPTLPVAGQRPCSVEPIAVHYTSASRDNAP